MDPIRRSPTFKADLTVLTLSRLKSQIAASEARATSGLKVHMPSDAPEIWTSMNRLRAESQDQRTFSENADRALTWLGTTENTYRSIGDLIKRVKERAIQLSSVSVASADRVNGANEIAALKRELVDLANTRIDGRYVFSGVATDTVAFDTNGVYQGSTEAPDVQVGNHTRIEVGYDGSQVFQGDVDIFQVFTDLQTALSDDDPAAANAMIEDIDAAFAQNIQWWEENGYRVSTMEDMQIVAQNLEYLSSSRLSDLVAIDPVAAYTELAQLRSTYETTLTVNGTERNTNLFSFLR